MSFRIPAQPEKPILPPPPPPAPDHSAALAELELWRAAFPFQTPAGIQNVIDSLREKNAELEALLLKMAEPEPAPKPKAKAKKAKK